MAFEELTNYLVAEPLKLPVKGRTYEVPPASAELGLWCRSIYSAGVAEDEDEEREARALAPKLPGSMTLSQRVLGPVWDAMVRDGVEDEYIEFCGSTAFIWIVRGEEAAELFWKSAGDPGKLQSPANRQERRAAERTGATSTGGASETPSPGSTSGTRSRRKSRRGSRPR
ncbi:hypothetical protein Ait01nite_030040 [Actinoplanes italicus]|uniref:DUF7426 domain-containing protein n=1 Tax=Actinoplanes italicus TaxID=113567 RepID=A0A2T0KIV3_9ACTN|nr:hypothetical protein [Actinoplanes italicus]PRX23461.1 hypothetical protein CLV67_103209 [Actinoplanes italicus]GIE29959.1 hypothetical protein Ait01nite_030040 [Actinoplanes italicus]